MDIKLGKRNRIRLQEADYVFLKERGEIEQLFEVARGCSFSIKMTNNLENETKVHFENLQLSIALSALDLERLMLPANKKEGIQVDRYVLQLDLWKKERETKSIE